MWCESGRNGDKFEEGWGTGQEMKGFKRQMASLRDTGIRTIFLVVG